MWPSHFSARCNPHASQERVLSCKEVPGTGHSRAASGTYMLSLDRCTQNRKGATCWLKQSSHDGKWYMGAWHGRERKDRITPSLETLRSESAAPQKCSQQPTCPQRVCSVLFPAVARERDTRWSPQHRSLKVALAGSCKPLPVQNRQCGLALNTRIMLAPARATPQKCMESGSKRWAHLDPHYLRRSQVYWTASCLGG